MNIEEIRKAKADAEAVIVKELQQFEAATGLKIAGVQVTEWDFSAVPRMIVGVDITATLS